MSWHCSLALGGGFSLRTYLAGLQSARWKSTSSDVESCCSDSVTASSSRSRFGMTSEHSTANRGGGSLTSSAEDSPARTSAQRVKVADLPEVVRAFGSSICESLKRLGLALSSRKTVRYFVPVASAPSSKDLPAWGMTCGGACWELGTAARLTTEIECGFWPTVTKSDASGGGCHPSEFQSGRRNRNGFSMNLRDAVRRWPTAASRDWKDTPGMAKTSTNKDGSKRNREDQLARKVYSIEQTPKGGGLLNPDWVEWLMGWPIGWTESRPLAMDKFRQWQQQHSEFFQRI